ncbi:RloB family protein [Psychrobacillus vulpis]|uniref:RloB domain-containing protein n=1 Tax=Psychrobacillus vulpis TaxID=2325572 RepID=A0A544TWI0_9BACI|nr:RloB family protein [Psychrobacillus vulpis]TQR21812.1 RloB domain-containing protein [Psychrobacillus vulpis]
MSRFGPRTSKGLKTSKTIYIFCEGKTEEVYFSKLNQMTKKANVKVVPKEVKMSGLELVEFAVRAEKSKPSEVYIVFDKDLNTISKIQKAYALAKKNGFKVHFTNICFELWFLLHYERVNNNPITDSQLYKKMNRHINIQDYKNRKAEQKLVHQVAKNFSFAVANNDELLKINSYWGNNPYSDISVLVKEIFL